MTAGDEISDGPLQSKPKGPDPFTEIDEKTRQQIIDAVSSELFDKWYREREFAENIRKGTAYFNGPANVQSPWRHSPSSLLQCHRKTVYKQLNAPAEKGDPRGIFWIGSNFEEDVALPFLREAVVGEDEYVTNSLWVDFTVETDVGDLRIKGETDPVIVDADAKPLILTEIKTKKSVDDVERPSTHHRAQAHTYMKGLSEKHDHNITDAVILYGSRTNLDIRAFHITFDPVFWRQTVVEWAASHTSYRIHEDLPPAEPEHGWECTFCPYRERCGKGDLEYSDVGPSGLLPGVSKYPKQKVIEYLEAHEDAKLTPTLAHQYPDLREEYEIYDWECRCCGRSYSWGAVDWNREASKLPRCPECPDTKPISFLGGPPPEEQEQAGGGDNGDG